MILPLGSGGFPAIRGAQHEPLWEPGRFPLTLAPHIAYDDALWMVSQTRAYSSPDGLTWTEHAKTERDDQLSLWTVIHTESGQIVGDVGLQHEDYGSGPVVGIGGRGNRNFWRQGMGFEAASATIDAGFEQLELAVIGAETRPENRPAQASLSKLGMQPAGTNADGWPVYMITCAEWLSRRNS
jgi:RimJ/RimL family protein N-acetyltransferase